MNILTGITVVFLMFGMFFVNSSFAQSSNSTKTVMQDILVHKMVNDTFVIEREQIEATIP